MSTVQYTTTLVCGAAHVDAGWHDWWMLAYLTLLRLTTHLVLFILSCMPCVGHTFLLQGVITVH